MATFNVLWTDGAGTATTDKVEADTMEISVPEGSEPLLELRKDGDVVAAYARSGGMGWLRCQMVSPAPKVVQ